MTNGSSPPSVAPAWLSPVPPTAVRGDVLIRTLDVRTRLAYALSAVPGPDQLAFATLSEATRHARDYAHQNRVDVWADRGTGHLERLVCFRPLSNVRTLPSRDTPAAELPHSAVLQSVTR